MHTWVHMCMNSIIPVRAGGCARQIVNKKPSFLTQYVTNQQTLLKKKKKRKKKKGIFITSP